MTGTRTTVAVIGAGTIGLSWTVLFLARGLRVRLHDPRPDLADAVDEALRQSAPAVPGFRGEVTELRANLELVDDQDTAVAGADVVQENGPENLDFKRRLFARIERTAPPHALLLSSTSGLPAGAMGRDLTEPGRLMVGHPFNPPHVVPLVELVPSPATPATLVGRAEDFYRSLGKTPVVVHKEIPGFVANRLQNALFAECVGLVEQGVVTPAELDEIVTNSIGVRWASIGPFLAFHLGGGPGGLRHMLEHLGPSMAEGWRRLSRPELTPELVERLSGLAEAEFGPTPYADLVDQRDRRQLAVLACRDK